MKSSSDDITIPVNIYATCAGRKVAIWGAGGVGRKLIQALTAAGSPPAAVFDDYAPPGAFAAGLPVLRGTDLGRIAPEVVVLATTRARARMRARLSELGYAGPILELPGEDDDIYAPCPEQRVSELEALRDRHRGRTAFVIGNGPSLQHTDPRRIRGAITIACNNIYLLDGFRPDYYMVTDVLLAQDRAGSIEALPWTKLFPHDLRRWLKTGLFLTRGECRS